MQLKAQLCFDLWESTALCSCLWLEHCIGALIRRTEHTGSSNKKDITTQRLPKPALWAGPTVVGWGDHPSPVSQNRCGLLVFPRQPAVVCVCVSRYILTVNARSHTGLARRDMVTKLAVLWEVLWSCNGSSYILVQLIRREGGQLHKQLMHCH